MNHHLLPFSHHILYVNHSISINYH